MKQTIIMLLTIITLNLNAQTLNDVKETSTIVKETVTNISKNAPKVAKSVKNGAQQIAEQTPGVLLQMGGAIKSGVNTTVGAAKDATNYVDTSSNFRWMLNKSEQFVLSAANAFKVGAEKVLYIMAKKYFLQGIYAWIIVIFCVIGVIFTYNKGSNAVKEQKEPIIWLPTLLILTVFVFAISLNLSDAINYTFNPEYYVLQELKDFALTVIK